MNLTSPFRYLADPRIRVTAIAPESGASVTFRAIIDTGSTSTLLDASIAADLGIELASAPSIVGYGVGGMLPGLRRAIVRLLLLDDEGLAVTVMASFGPQIAQTVGNLIGLDALASIDFGLSHAQRTGYLGVALQP